MTGLEKNRIEERFVCMEYWENNLGSEISRRFNLGREKEEGKFRKRNLADRITAGSKHGVFVIEGQIWGEEKGGS